MEEGKGGRDDTDKCDFEKEPKRDINAPLLLRAVCRRCAHASLSEGVVGAIIEDENLSRLDWPERFDHYALVAPVRNKRSGVWSFTVRAVVVDESG